jgi:site-specific DNA recombinase
LRKVNCAIYVRKSTEKGLDMEFNSLQNQEEACKNYILSQAFNGWEYFKTYTDSGISGGTMNRPALQEMLEDIKKGLVQLVAVYKVDRLSRSIIDFHNMIKEFEKYNCDFVSITQAFDTSTSMGKLTLNMLLSFAQFEREVSSERIRDKIIASKQKGFWTGGPPPLGYDVVDKKLVVNQKEAELVRFIFEKYRELGSLNKLSELLLEKKILSKKWTTKDGREMGGKVYEPEMAGHLLRSKIYIGMIEYKKESKAYPGKHKAIINKELFDEVRAMLEDRQNDYNTTHERNAYLLSGKIFDEKGRVFKNQKTSKNAQKKYRYYALKGLYLPAGDFERITTGVIRELLNYPLGDILNASQTLEFKSIDFETLTVHQQSNLVRVMVDKVIYHDSKFMIFFRIGDICYLKAFKRKNFINTRNEASGDLENSKIYTSSDGHYLVLEIGIRVNNHHLSNKYKGESRNIVSMSENSISLIKALSIGWRYGKMQSGGLMTRDIQKIEKKTGRTIYKYLNLNYLSPRIVNDIMESKVPPHINLQTLFEIASKYMDFKEQEREFYQTIDFAKNADV